MKYLLIIAALIAGNVQAERVGKVTTSGWLFKDSIVIDSFRDHTISGVACHVTSPNRALSFEDQSNSSIACRQVGKISGDYKKNVSNIFSKSKNFFFKKMLVDRFWDKKNKVLVYISYTKKSKGTNASHSVSSIALYKN